MPAPRQSPLRLVFSDDDHPLLRGADAGQRAAITHHRGPLAVVAGAGAGKTTALERRIAYLNQVHGVPLDRVLGVAFSRDAAKYLAARVTKLVGVNAASILTFHALARAICAAEDPAFPGCEPDPGKADVAYARLVRDACGKRMKWYAADVSHVLSFIDLAKANVATADPASEEAFWLARRMSRGDVRTDAKKVWEAFQIAEADRRATGLATFADWLVDAARFLEDEETRRRWAARWDYVLVDENQDTSGVQIAVTNALAQDHRNLMMVGDGKQAIFAWRGAVPKDFLEFPERWQAPVVQLATNYRSGAAIVALGNEIAGRLDEPDAFRITMAGSRGLDGCIRLRRYQGPEAEAGAVVDRIRAAKAAGGTWADHAVLVRVNALSRAAEEALAKAKIPFVVATGMGFWARHEVRALLAYLRLAAKQARPIDARTSLVKPFRFLPATFLGALEEAARSGACRGWSEVVEVAAKTANLPTRSRERAREWVDLVAELQADVVAGRGPAQILQTTLARTDFVEALKREGEETLEGEAEAAVGELVRAAAPFASVGDLLAHAAAAEADAGDRRGKKKATGDRVTLASIHAAKGREWRAVHVLQVQDGVLPHARSGDTEEERRLAYVAVTRARDELHLSFVGDMVSPYFRGLAVEDDEGAGPVQDGRPVEWDGRATGDEEGCEDGWNGEIEDDL